MNDKAATQPPPVPAEQPTKMEAWYMECLRRWIRLHDTYPVIRELADFCGKSRTAVYSALVALENKGWVKRVDASDDRRFMLVGKR